MGIITDPGYGLYDPHVEECFPAGLTPKKLYCTLSGVNRGQLWLPWMGSCMNGTYIVEWVSLHLWKWGSAYPSVNVHLSKAWCSFIVQNENNMRVFESKGLSDCGFERETMFPCPGIWFCGGFFSVTVREPIAGVPSIQNVMNLMGIPRARKTFAELSMDDKGKRIVRLARQKDGTCIRVKLT